MGSEPENWLMLPPIKRSGWSYKILAITHFSYSKYNVPTLLIRQSLMNVPFWEPRSVTVNLSFRLEKAMLQCCLLTCTSAKRMSWGPDTSLHRLAKDRTTCQICPRERACYLPTHLPILAPSTVITITSDATYWNPSWTTTLMQGGHWGWGGGDSGNPRNRLGAHSSPSSDDSAEKKEKERGMSEIGEKGIKSRSG